MDKIVPRKGGKVSVSIFDWDLQQPINIMDCDYWFNWSSEKPYNVFDRAGDTLMTAIHDGRIFITRADSLDLSIDVFGHKGGKKFKIERKSEELTITPDFVIEMKTYFQFKYKIDSKDPFFKKIHIPAFFPAVQSLHAADRKLYVITFKIKDAKTTIQEFSMTGDFIGERFVPLKRKNPEQLFPFSISGSKLYQFVENEQSENRELFITPLI